ncbi:MAG: GNAT family N-acetyltransferase [Anaerolineae bacterium]|nr:GNAT family N-acetyltransferase [Anaerolineae bacterium]
MRMRAFTPGDRKRMLDLLVSYRAAGYVTRYPTVWRFQLLFDSRVWDVEHDVQLWEDAQGQLAACALLWKRRPEQSYYALERVFHPEITEPGLPAAVLDWAIARTTAESVDKHVKISLAAFPLEKNIDQDIRLLENKGFSRGTKGYNVYMSMPLTHPVTPAVLPDGFQLQPLAEEDLECYQAAYGFTAVTIEHQRALLHSPEYQHFIIKAPDGTLAAYVECSFSQDEWTRNQQRVGWIDYVQTQPDFHRHGLAQALMLAGFEHLRKQGATCIMLITRHDNEPAQALFKKVGMSFAGEEYVYQKEIDASS